MLVIAGGIILGFLGLGLLNALTNGSHRRKELELRAAAEKFRVNSDYNDH